MCEENKEGELNDLVCFNEEMQTMWSEKDLKVRDVLEKFSAYRHAVEVDSKEKDELFVEEIHKRELIVKDLELTNHNLMDEINGKNKIIKEIIKGFHELEASRVQELSDVHDLATSLTSLFSDEDSHATVTCRTVCLKLETFISGLQKNEYTSYISCLNVDPDAAKESEISYNISNAGKSFSSSVDEGTGFSILSSSDGEKERNDFINSTKPLEVVFSSQEESSHEIISGSAAMTSGDTDVFETLEEDLEKLLQDIVEREDDSVRGYVEKEAVMKLLEEQSSKYQFVCREKDEEMRYWRRKHRQDTKNLQDILEEQERVETRNGEWLLELQIENEKLRQRNKFLESEVEFAKEQGEDDVSLLRESFQKDLSAQLRRQSQSFLFAEESTKSELAELKTENEELRRENSDLRRQISDHCGEIKVWASEILSLTDEEYDEEFQSISDVLEKLQKILMENKRNMNDLREQMKQLEDEPSSQSDMMLSRSFGGNSWNSIDSQRDLCRKCRQTKWQRILRGSFDLVDSSAQDKQEDIEKFVGKINIDGPKHRKKHCLKESLEFADAQLELFERFGKQNLDSLGTLSENSVEENDEVFYSQESEKDDRNVSKVCSVDNESWKSIHVSPRVLKQFSILSDPEKAENLPRKLHHEQDCEGNKESGHFPLKSNEEEKLRAEKKSEGNVNVSGSSEDNVVEEEERLWISQDDPDAEDMVHVVNLYRSLILDRSGPEQNDLASNEGLEHDSVDEKDQLASHGREKLRYASKRNLLVSDDELDLDVAEMKQPESLEKLDFVSKEASDGISSYDFIDGMNILVSNEKPEHQSLGSFDVTETIGRTTNIKNQPKILDSIPISIPKIVLADDLNQNILEIDQDKDHGELDAKDQHDIRMDAKEVDYDHENEILQLRTEASESWIFESNPDQFIFEFTGIFDDESVSLSSCSHCSGIFGEQLKTFKEKLAQMMFQRTKDERKISMELHDTKIALQDCKNRFETMQNLVEEYRTSIDEFSKNLKNKNSELRKLKLDNGIMKTEIEWLRQALGITRKYAEF